MQKRANLDLAEGPVLRKLFLFAIPLLMNSLTQTLYSTVDKIMVGQFVSTNAMAAVGASSPPLNLMINLFAGIALGVNVNCANLRGAKKDRELADASHTSVLLGLLVGCLIAALGAPLARPLLLGMSTPTNILDDASLYMLIRLLGGPTWMLGAFMANIFYGHGNSRLPMVLNIFSGLANVLLNALFIFVFGMGVEGVALATVAAEAINAVVYFIVLYNPKGQYKLRLKELKLHTLHVRKVLAVGIPAGIGNIAFSLSNVLLQSSVNSFGEAVVAGNSAADSITTYVGAFMSSLTSAALSATSQSYGAGKYKRIDEITVKACLGSIALVVAASGLITLFARPLLGLFVKKDTDGWQEVVELGIPKLMIVCWGYIIFSIPQVLAAVLKGIRAATSATVCNMGGVIIPRLLWIWFVVPNMHTPGMLYAIYPISWSISAALLLYAYMHYRKKRLTPQPA